MSLIWEDLLADPDRLLWEHLSRTEKQIVLWGTGNGADKILAVLREKQIPVQAVFASDGFRQGKLFQDMRVESRRDVFDRFGAENLIVLLAFASARPEVLANVRAVMETAEFYVPDVPAVGDGLFDADFVRQHREELDRTRALLADGESQRIFDLTVAYKLSGRAEYLFEAANDRAQTLEQMVQPRTLRTVLDLGAYTGDTVRELLEAGARPEWVFAVEPDERTVKKLTAYAQEEMRTSVLPVHAAAWDRRETLRFSAAGNRGAALGTGAGRTVEVPGIPGDEVLGETRADYIKFDIEGAEQQAIEGLQTHIARDLPTLLVSVYHRNEDLFALPLMIRERFAGYRAFYLRRFAGLPAWDLNLYVRKERVTE